MLPEGDTLRSLAWLFAGASLALVLFWLARSATRERRRRIVRARLARAADGERRAAHLLQRAGYEVIGAQVRASYALVVDGQPRSFEVRADYLAMRAGRTFVADVKTGALAPSLDEAATRRQLIEYGVAFRAHGLLLVDAETDRVHVIDVPWALPSTTSRVRAALPLVFVSCAVLGSIVALVR